jgi:hypothetical protein
MTSFDCHYRVDVEESAIQHVTFDSGVAELRAVAGGVRASQYVAGVDLVRVGVLKDIMVLSYENLSVVLMVVSWVAKHTCEQPRLSRDAHGFWLANMAAEPRDVTAPYMLPALASQVRRNVFYYESLQHGLLECERCTEDNVLTSEYATCRCSSWTTSPSQDGVLY